MRRRVLIPRNLAPIGVCAGPDGPVETIGGRTMGTTWSIRFCPPPCHGAAALRDAVEGELARLVAQLSHWEPDSALCRFNRAPAGTRHRLPDDLFTVLSAGCAVAKISGGAYDPTLGALVDLWGFGPPGPVFAPPDATAVAEALARSGWDKLALDPLDRTALQPGGLRLDLSGIAKGHAVDAVSDLLLARGVESHLVEIGGELRGRGLKPRRQPWWVALEAPEGQAAMPDTVVALCDLGVATSGDYRRSLGLGPRRVGHTLDPGKGAPLAAGLLSATVLHPSCMMADAYATALMVMGADDGHRLADELRLAARLVAADGSGLVERTSRAFDALAE